MPKPAPLILIHVMSLQPTHVQNPADAETLITPPPPPLATEASPGDRVMMHPPCGGTAMTIPVPESRSAPGASMSVAPPTSVVTSCVCDQVECCDISSAISA